eukprot:TRINITY_DN559_c0_g1_i1.p1 TRINITY_DN559_c0_g1~~TRINITY_DN559_c0_g1_i1.p1  ORF type:complete len:280 (+),score=60.09 TRINITY_DN559_c0_g1_i1:48-887(+)
MFQRLVTGDDEPSPKWSFFVGQSPYDDDGYRLAPISIDFRRKRVIQTPVISTEPLHTKKRKSKRPIGIPQIKLTKPISKMATLEDSDDDDLSDFGPLVTETIRIDYISPCEFNNNLELWILGSLKKVTKPHNKPFIIDPKKVQYTASPGNPRKDSKSVGKRLCGEERVELTYSPGSWKVFVIKGLKDSKHSKHSSSKDKSRKKSDSERKHKSRQSSSKSSSDHHRHHSKKDSSKENKTTQQEKETRKGKEKEEVEDVEKLRRELEEAKARIQQLENEQH